MSQPAAPYFERAVFREVMAICTEHGLRCQTDEYGNLIVRLQEKPRARPVVLAAHMDHPGFELLRRLDNKRWLARFHGGVPDSYFRPGVPVRLMQGNRPAKLGRRHGRPAVFELRETGRPAGAEQVARPTFAVWDLPDFKSAGGQIAGRSCDDLIGVASILAALIELKKRRSPAHVIGLISRAEEIGFKGALTLAAAAWIPKRALVISLETSKELPPVRMGEGVIVRVGDRTSIFDSQATRYLTEIARQMQGTGLKWQRALMSGGTCEATAYQEFGYQTCAVCVALGNYHNCAPKNRIASEYIAIRDALAMVDLLVQAARRISAFDTITGGLIRRLHTGLRIARRELKKR